MHDAGWQNLIYFATAVITKTVHLALPNLLNVLRRNLLLLNEHFRDAQY